MCAQCSANYYQLSSRCYFCGSSNDQTRTIFITLVVALIATSLLAVCVAFMRAIPLAQTIQLFLLLQDVSMMGVEGAKSSPFQRELLVTIATYVNFINWDVEVFKPGQSVAAAGG